MTVLEDERPTRLVIGEGGRAVDIHPVRFDAEGGGWQALPEGRAFRYPPEGFHGTGIVAGRPVACLSAETQDSSAIAATSRMRRTSTIWRSCARTQPYPVDTSGRHP